MANLLETFEKGQFGNLGKPDRVIETVISKLFFYGDDVYKVYKYIEAFFGNFSDDRFRHEFYHDDFTWNSTMAPDIYRKLGYVKKDGDTFIESTHDKSDDYYILMKRIDDSQTLFNHLKKGTVTKETLKQVIEEMLQRTKKLTEIKKTDMQDLFDTSYVKLDLRNLETTREWLYMAPDFIPKEESNAIIDKLKTFVANNSYFKNFSGDNYQASVDNHTGNILYSGGDVDFIDSMPPMRIWRIQSDIYSVSRPATDVEVMLGKEHADHMYQTFERIRNTKVDPTVRMYLQIVAALIQAPYLKILKEDALADKFLAFAREKLKELGN